MSERPPPPIPPSAGGVAASRSEERLTAGDATGIAFQAGRLWVRTAHLPGLRTAGRLFRRPRTPPGARRQSTLAKFYLTFHRNDKAPCGHVRDDRKGQGLRDW